MQTENSPPTVDRVPRPPAGGRKSRQTPAWLYGLAAGLVASLGPLSLIYLAGLSMGGSGCNPLDPSALVAFVSRTGLACLLLAGPAAGAVAGSYGHRNRAIAVGALVGIVPSGTISCIVLALGGLNCSM